MLSTHRPTDPRTHPRNRVPSMYSYMLEKKRPDLVRRMVAIDIGGVLKPPPLGAIFIVSYHLWLITAFLLGGPIGNAMSRAFAWLARAPLRSRVARASVGYPYYHLWKRKLSKTEEDVPPMMPEVPLLFLYGTAGVKKTLVSFLFRFCFCFHFCFRFCFSFCSHFCFCSCFCS